MQDVIGQRGENIFVVRITEADGERGPLFRPQFLGDKFPFVDYLVLLEGNAAWQPFFFVQVKTTRDGYTKKAKRLKVQVTQEHLRGLAAFPAPTYIVGVDYVTEAAFVVSANGESSENIPSLNTKYPLNARNRILLWNEVAAYWDRSMLHTSPKMESMFSNLHGE